MLKENLELAEMVGIALGDGSIPKNKKYLRITLNKTEEPQYTQHVNGLMLKILNKKPSIYEPKDANAIKLTVCGKKLVETLIDKGLKPGDKKENQVNVPQWIKDNKDYRISCLRGLVDTDGSIHVHKYSKNIRIGFKNASYPLVKDFKDMCESNDLKPGKIYPVKGQNTYDLKIENKQDVSKFLDKVQPRKWKNRAKTIGLVLKSISDPEKRVKIEKELFQFYPDKRVHYTSEYMDHLKKLCEKHGYDVSNESIIKEVENALTYDLNYKNLTNDKIIELNILAKKVIDDLKQILKSSYENNKCQGRDLNSRYPDG